MPKMFALERAEGLALFAARPLELFARVFRAPLWFSIAPARGSPA